MASLTDATRSAADSLQSESIGAPIDHFLDLIHGRYKADIVILLGKSDRRFSDLKRSIPHVSDRVLARQLKGLERGGVISRAAFAETPPRVVYSLTPYGRTLCPLLKAIWNWGANRVR